MALRALLRTAVDGRQLRAQSRADARADPSETAMAAELADSQARRRSVISSEQASRFAKLPLASIHREYPNKLDHVINDAGDVALPSALHPAFYGCFDWHSSVHGHWMLVRLLKLFPQLPEAAEIRAALDRSLTPANIAVEVAYLHQPNRQSFERMYGWAWLLQLATELRGFGTWAETLQPLVDVLVERTHDFLPKQTY